MGPTLRAPSLDAFWMPFTSNASFKQAPRMLRSAKGMYYQTLDGREVLDATSGLWCVNAGHGRTEIAEAVASALRELDYAPTFQMGHPAPFSLANRIADLAPSGLDRVFFANSGSEAVDSALKIALAYWHARGETQRSVLVGRTRGYHGAGFGGISVGGIPTNREPFELLPRVDHLPHTWAPEKMAFSEGQPSWGAHLADDLHRLVEHHGPGRIAAVVVEPVAGSTGVLVPPIGYLERLRTACDEHGILLIFDEVITAFGRLGTPFAAHRFGVTPDMIVMAKALTNGAIPMGAVAVRREIHDEVVGAVESGIELPHGYTCSGNPAACAAAEAALDIYEREGLFERARKAEPGFSAMLHSLRSAPGVTDVRNLGLMGAVDLEPSGGKGARGARLMQHCYDQGVLIRVTGDTVALSPPLIVEESQIERMGELLRAGLTAVS